MSKHFLLLITVLTINQFKSQTNQSFNLFFDESTTAYSALMRSISFQKNDSIEIGLNLGEGEGWLIDYYFSYGRMKHINGEDVVGYREKYYKEFLYPIKKKLGNDRDLFVCLDFQNTNIRKKLAIISELGFYNERVNNHYALIDSLRNTNFRSSQGELIKKTEFFIKQFKDTSIGINLFRENYELVKTIINEIEIIAYSDSSNKIDQYYDNQCKDIELLYFLNPNYYFISYLSRNEKDVTIYISKKTPAKKIKMIKEKFKYLDNKIIIYV